MASPTPCFSDSLWIHAWVSNGAGPYSDEY